MESTVKYAVKEEAQLKYPMLMKDKGSDCIVFAFNEYEGGRIEGTVVHSGGGFCIGHVSSYWEKDKLEVFEGEVILKQ